MTSSSLKFLHTLLALVALLLSESSPAVAQQAPFEDPPTVRDAEPKNDVLDTNPNAGSDRRRRKVFRGWPLLFIEESAEGERELDAFFSLYHRRSGGPEETLRIAPFYFSRTDHARDEASSLLLPLYYYDRARTDWSLYTPLLGLGGGEKDWYGAPLFLSFFRGESGPGYRRDRAGVWPLFDLYGRSRGPGGTSFDLLGLGAWQQPGNSFLPIFRHRTGTSGAIQESAVFPLYHYRNRPAVGEEGDPVSASKDLLIPALGWWQTTSGERTHRVFFPLLADYQTDPDGYRARALLGLWDKGRQGEESWFRLEPLYSRRQGPESGDFKLLRLFGRSWRTEGNYRATHVIPPLGRFETDEYGYRNYFLPFFYSRGTSATSPVQSSTRAIVPFYYASVSPNRTRRFIFPAFYRDSGHGSGTRVVFPLYWEQWKDKRVNAEGESPAWERGRGYRHLFPIYASAYKPDESWQSWLGPLYFHHERFGRSEAGSEPTRVENSHSFLWPFFQYATGPDTWHARALPFYWGTRRGGFELDVVAPLYLRAKTPESSHHWFLPVYGHMKSRTDDVELQRDFFAGGALIRSETTYLEAAGNADEESNSNSVAADANPSGRVSWSLFGPMAGVAYSKNGEAHHSRFLPLWWRTHERDHDRTILFPLYYQSADRGGRSDGESAQSSGAGSSSAGSTSATFSIAGSSKLTLVGGNLWVDYQNETRRERGVLYPLSRYSQTQSEEGTRESAHLLGLLGRTTGPRAGKRWRVSPLVFSARSTAEPSDHEWWHLISSQSGPWGERQRIMPFLFQHERIGQSLEDGTRVAERRRTDALFSMFHSSSGPDESRAWALPFFFRRSFEGIPGEPSTDTLVFPFYYSSHRPLLGRSQFSILFPIYTRIQNGSGTGATIRHSLLGPVFHRHTAPGYKKVSSFPLFGWESWESGAKAWNLSLLYRSRSAAPSAEVDGLWSTDGYLGFELLRSARGANTGTFAMHPFLFGYHRNDEADTLEWNNLLYLNRYRREGEDVRYSALGLIQGSSNDYRAWNTVFPFYFSDDLRSGQLPSFSLPGAVHLYSRLQNSEESRWSTLGYLAYGSNDKRNDDYQFRVLYRGVAWTRSGSYRERVIEPLFTWEKDDVQGSSYFSLVKFLYIAKRDDAESPTKRYLLGIPLQW